MIDLETISVIVFLVVVVALAIWDRKNIEFNYGVLMRKTKKGKKWLYDVAKKHPKLISKTATVGVVVGVIISVITFFLLALSVYNMFAHPEEAVKVGPPARVILPQAGGVKYPSFILGVPFWYWLIAIFVVVSVHEPFHAIVARLKNVTIKSLGIGLFLIFPLAFVEPDENQIKRLDRMSKAKIYAAGSFANLLTALIILIIGWFLVTNVMAPYGVGFDSTIPDTPAEKANLQGVITSVKNQYAGDLSDFIEIMEGIKPNETIAIVTTSGEYTLTTISHPENSSKAFIGIRGSSSKYRFIGIFSGYGEPSETFLNSYVWISNLAAWLFIINLAVGAVNLLPIKPLDGGLMYEAILSKYFKRNVVKNIIILLSSISIFLLIMSLFGVEIIKLIVS